MQTNLSENEFQFDLPGRIDTVAAFNLLLCATNKTSGYVPYQNISQVHRPIPQASLTQA